MKGAGNQIDYGFRIYDPRLARFLSVDPLNKQYPWYTPYQFAGNTPIQAIDVDGLEPATNISAETIWDMGHPLNTFTEKMPFPSGTVIWKVDGLWVHAAAQGATSDMDYFQYWDGKEGAWKQFNPPTSAQLSRERTHQP